MNNDLLTMSAGACGSYTVMASDECGQVGAKSCRVTNNGYWSVPVRTWYSPSAPDCTGGSGYISSDPSYIEGNKQIKKFWQGYMCCDGGICHSTVESCTEQRSVATKHGMCSFFACESDQATFYQCLLYKVEQEWICDE